MGWYDEEKAAACTHSFELANIEGNVFILVCERCRYTKKAYEENYLKMKKYGLVK